MNRPLRSHLKDWGLHTISALTGRHAVLLPQQARANGYVLALRAPYRVIGDSLTVELEEPGAGRLAATLLGYVGHFPRKTIWQGAPREYSGPSRLTVDCAHGIVRLDDQEWGRLKGPLTDRRFCWQLVLSDGNGHRRERLTGHYRVLQDKPIGESYFHSENYVDYEAETAGDYKEVLALVQQWNGREPLLEIGCATGNLLANLEARGIRGLGVDLSEWALTRARERLGPDRVYACNLDTDPLPRELVRRAPFRTVVMRSVLEHFSDPFAALAKLTPLVESGSLLLLSTTNANSLSHHLFERDWEGYVDWSHFGIERVSVETLRQWLRTLGWRIAALSTHLVWDRNADPTHATLRDWWAADARFRRLLVERDLGDLITCVAVRS